MNRPLVCTIGLAVLVGTPLPALAQAWPATVVSGASGLASRVPAPRFATVERDIVVLRPPGAAPTQPGSRVRSVIVRRPVHVGDVPEVEVPAKAAWLDDEGLRLTPTRVAYKHRF